MITMQVRGKMTSVRWRLTLWNTATFAALLITLGLLFGLLARHYLYAALDREMSSHATRMQETHIVKRVILRDDVKQSSVTMGFVSEFRTGQVELGRVAKPFRVEIVENMAQAVGDRAGQFQYRAFGLDGKPLLPPSPPVPPRFGLFASSAVVAIKQEQEKYTPWDMSALKRAIAGSQRFTDIAVQGAPLRILSIPLRDEGRIIGAAQIAAPLEPLRRDVSGLFKTLFLMLPPALLIAALAGVFLTDRALRPVHALTRAAVNIRPEQLQRRLPVSGADEFDNLAGAFNRALDRVELAFREREAMVEQLRRFTGDASHELRTPLTTIKANTGVALSEPVPCDEHVHALQQIERAADRMASLVDDLLLLARSDAGQLELVRAWHPVSAILQEALNLVPQGPETAPARIDCDVDIKAYGDAEQLIRVFRNLLENAVRFTPAQGCVTASAKLTGDFVEVTIADTGAGIAPEHLEHISERFYRADSGRNRKHGGAGLGLAICRSIVEKHGGTMSIDSNIGIGTVVTIVLPQDERTSQSQDFVRSSG